ncbi:MULTISPECIES: hypothetical protein [unclassified Enterobacter]|uniref:hypothetical protein n=1 Tax=unclassified Enterobacter TaxID=2608935 RepID=UPI0015C69B8F|nr:MULTISPECIES: hypothetical protein [unclassified Enterobacter]MBB3306975.1 hypothetical protein [Enterobacter sp. Sphag1F]NYI15701.1 hypothetical protein [Enterobacter sp. Sphag71]
MPEYCFFKKGNHINALERSDIAGASDLTAKGYEKQFEELHAPDVKHALARFIDIRKEEQTTTHSFVTGAVFASLLVGVVAVASWFFIK